MQELAYYLRRIGELGLTGSLHQARKIVFRRMGSPRQPQVTSQDILRLTEFSSAAELANHLRTRSLPVFFIDRDPQFYRSALTMCFPGEREKIIEAAGLIMSHTFDLLGSGPTHLDALKQSPIKIIGKSGRTGRIEQPLGYLPWHVDFKTGVGWDLNTSFKKIRYGHMPGVDVKVPWELSRFQHLIPLAQAYCLTQNETYTDEFVLQISDWIDANPCPRGVNWACTMEVGIRAVNWIWAFALFRQSPHLSDAFILTFVTAMLTHAQFIRRNLEFNSEYVNGVERRLNSNHYLSDLVGLAYIALLFPELKLDGDAQFAREELETELFEQIWPDGASYENATGYQGLICELFFSAFLLYKKNGYSLKPEIEERLQRMAEYVAGYTRPDGTAPQIGDADNGRLHPLSSRDIRDQTYLPLVIAEAFNRPDLRIKPGDPEIVWWLGSTDVERLSISLLAEEGRGQRPDAPGWSTRNNISSSYANGSFFILRSQTASVYISAAQVGMRGFGSHSHNDILSFEYWANGHAWMIDPGTYTYTADGAARNDFRSTASHNTVRVDGQEINPFHKGRLFQISDFARVGVRQWTSTPVRDCLEAEHTGYTRLPDPITHRRMFEFDKTANLLTVRDEFEGRGEHVFEWFFHVSPKVAVEENHARFTLRAADKNVVLDITGIPGNVDVQGGWYSPSYGIRQPAKVIKVRLKTASNLVTKFTIQP